MTQQTCPPDRRTGCVSRRTALTGVATLGVGVPLLAACGSDNASTGATATDTGESAAGSGGASSGASGASGALTTTADVEVGGGTILGDQEVVVVQPTAGDFKAYSAVCTHQGCLVGSVTSDGIECPCHGSVFSLDDGSPISGPADSPLPSVAITVTGDQITLA